MHDEIGAVAHLHSAVGIGFQRIQHDAGLRAIDAGFLSHPIDDFVSKTHEGIKVSDVGAHPSV